MTRDPKTEELSAEATAQELSPETAGSALVLTNSVAGSLWTAVSRGSGLIETIAVGAVLGATYLGNTFQAVNSLPNVVYYQLLAGSLFASLLVPPLVRHLDEGERERARKVVGGFLGTLLLVGLAFCILMIVASPLIMRLLTLGVKDAQLAEAQTRVGRILLAMFVPQIIFYLIAGTGGAVMNAHGKFALAAAAPAIENAGIITVLVIAAVVFGTGTGIGQVSNAELLLLGLGTTAAVGLHAAAQWLGARSSGTTMWPSAGWRDPEVQVVLRRILPTLAYTGLAASQIVAVYVVADRVRGGLVAFQLALSFFYLPTAVVTWPIARALLPQLSRLHYAGDLRGFDTELMRSMSLASFIAIPTAVAYVVLAVPMAKAITFGQLGTPEGVSLVARSLAALAPGVVGETWFILGTYAFYSRQDVRSPLRSMMVRVGLALSLMAASWLVEGADVLPMIGLALSAGSLIGAWHMWARIRKQIPSSGYPFGRSLGRSAIGSVIMAVPAGLTILAFRQLPDTQLLQALAMVVAAAVGLVTYVFVEGKLGAPEVRSLRGAIMRGRTPNGSEA